MSPRNRSSIFWRRSGAYSASAIRCCNEPCTIVETPGKGEATIALINIVFLMLIFFLIAGQIAPPVPQDLNLASARDLEAHPPPDALVLTAGGELRFRGQAATVEGFMQGQQDPVARLVPDREVPAKRLMEVAASLRAAGAERVILVAERGLE
jgi:biopolymer transport protein ExbD